MYKALKKYNGHTQIQNPHDPQARYSRKRSNVEGSLSELVRGHEMRVSRYSVQKKRNVQAIFTGCAANLKRTAPGWPVKDRKCETRKAGP